MPSSEPSKRFPARIIVLVTVASVIVAAITMPFVDYSDIPWENVIAALGLVIPVCAVLWEFAFRSREDQRLVESRRRVREAEQGLERALRGSRAPSEDGPAPDLTAGSEGGAAQESAQARLTLSELWTVTHRRLDHYHSIALGQAKLSFRNAQIAMVLGFGLLIGFVVVALNASTTAGSVVAGGLGAVSAALAGYVSRTFVRSQETAAGHLRAYFDQPLEFSRYLAAERLVVDAGLSEEQRAEVLSALVQSMIAGPPLPLPPSEGNGQQPSGNTP